MEKANRKWKKETYTLKFLDNSYYEVFEAESDEEAINKLVSFFPVSIINLNPPTFGWVWKNIMIERKVIRSD